MRIRILRQVASSVGTYMPGDVREVPDKIAKAWIKSGIAMKDKSLDGASEVK